MDKFEVLHKYNRLVRREMARPLTCDRDGIEYVVRLNDGVTPKLHCYGCGSDYYPSDREYADIQHKVETRLK